MAHQHSHSHGDGHGHSHGSGHTHDFDSNLEKWLERLESSRRITTNKFPETMEFHIKHLFPEEEDEEEDEEAGKEQKPKLIRIAEIGSGTGIWVFYLATAIRDKLTSLGDKAARYKVEIVAADPSPVFFDHVTSLLKEGGERAEFRDMITAVKCGLRDPGFEDLGMEPGTFDLIAMNTTYHHVDDRVPYFRNLARWFRPNTGYFFSCDWSPEPEKEAPFGPPLENKLPRAQVVSEMKQAGFVPAERFSEGLAELDRILPYHYNLAFQPEA